MGWVTYNSEREKLMKHGKIIEDTLSGDGKTASSNKLEYPSSDAIRREKKGEWREKNGAFEKSTKWNFRLNSLSPHMLLLQPFILPFASNRSFFFLSFSLVAFFYVMLYFFFRRVIKVNCIEDWSRIKSQSEALSSNYANNTQLELSFSFRPQNQNSIACNNEVFIDCIFSRSPRLGAGLPAYLCTHFSVSRIVFQTLSFMPQQQQTSKWGKTLSSSTHKIYGILLRNNTLSLAEHCESTPQS